MINVGGGRKKLTRARTIQHEDRTERVEQRGGALDSPWVLLARKQDGKDDHLSERTHLFATHKWFSMTETQYQCIQRRLQDIDVRRAEEEAESEGDSAVESWQAMLPKPPTVETLTRER